MEAGLDSLGAVELRNAVANTFALDLPATVMLDYPTLASLKDYILTRLQQDIEVQNSMKSLENLGAQLDVANLPSAYHLHLSDDIAKILGPRRYSYVIGVSCRYPLPANSGVEGFFNTMSACVDMPTLVPLQRWDVDPHYDPDASLGKIYARFATFIDNIEAFDNVLFRISKSEAISMDPQCRILLEEVHIATKVDKDIRSNGAHTMDDNEIGVYVGCMYQEYTDVLSKSGGALSSSIATGNSLNFMAGR
jgi:hypothetical protein